MRIAFYISETENIDAESYNKSVFFRKYSFPIFSASPVSKEPKLVQRLDSIQIFSTEVIYSQTKSYYPGEALNDLFLINGMLIADFLKEHKTTPITGGDEKCSACFNNYTITYLSLLTKPAKPIDQTLYLKLTYDNGGSSEFETPVLKVEAE
ncbi:MAG: hypothetical protein ABJG41_01950 [Cyclobacteriaceae bacterium]